MGGRRRRRRFLGTEKVAIVKRHLLDQVPVMTLCKEYDLHPNVYYRWQREFFEGGAVSFGKHPGLQNKALQRRVAKLQEKVARKDAALDEITEAYARGKQSDDQS